MDRKESRLLRKKEDRDGTENKEGSTEPGMPAYCKQGRKNEVDPDVDCQVTFST